MSEHGADETPTPSILEPLSPGPRPRKTSTARKAARIANSTPTPLSSAPAPRRTPRRPPSLGPSPWKDELNWQQLIAAVIRLGYDQTQPITTAEVIVQVVIDHPEAYDGHRVPELMPVRVDAEREQVLASMPYQEYLLSPEWDARRKDALKRAGYLCRVCNRSRVLHVHHRTYERRGAELPGDLTVLCDECHALFHGKNLIRDDPDSPTTGGPSS